MPGIGGAAPDADYYPCVLADVVLRVCCISRQEIRFRALPTGFCFLIHDDSSVTYSLSVMIHLRAALARINHTRINRGRSI